MHYVLHELKHVVGSRPDACVHVSVQGDHYVTAVESDGTVIKDMVPHAQGRGIWRQRPITGIHFRNDLRVQVDYDSNLLAVASGLAPQDRAKQILGRIDKYVCLVCAGLCVGGDLSMCGGGFLYVFVRLGVLYTPK